MPNHQVYVLDQHLQPVPIGVAGLLYVGGVGLARGYLGRPDLTAERFIPNPFASVTNMHFAVCSVPTTADCRLPTADCRLYKTGDRVRFLPDGNLDFLGRTDHQIKIRGFRVELGEIEAVLRSHPDVRELAVVAYEVGPGDTRLAAYVVTKGELQAPDGPDAPPLTRGSLLGDELYRWAQQRLPEHMIPSALVPLDALPLTPSGKLDRRALPEPDWSRRARDADYVAPRTPVEQHVAGLMAQMLGAERVGLHDNFFALGGHSLLATRLVVQLSEVFRVKLPLRSLFEAPTVANLAERIETLLWMIQGQNGAAGAAAEGHERGAI